MLDFTVGDVVFQLIPFFLVKKVYQVIHLFFLRDFVLLGCLRPRRLRLLGVLGDLFLGGLLQ